MPKKTMRSLRRRERNKERPRNKKRGRKPKKRRQMRLEESRKGKRPSNLLKIEKKNSNKTIKHLMSRLTVIKINNSKRAEAL